MTTRESAVVRDFLGELISRVSDMHWGGSHWCWHPNLQNIMLTFGCYRYCCTLTSCSDITLALGAAPHPSRLEHTNTLGLSPVHQAASCTLGREQVLRGEKGFLRNRLTLILIFLLFSHFVTSTSPLFSQTEQNPHMFKPLCAVGEFVLQGLLTHI